ncbi:MAG TPA: HEAT repeat domain-containing protein [Spirillospora sp.]
MLRNRTKRLADTYVRWYDRIEVKGVDLDAAEVMTRMRALREGTLGPRAAASALRDAAVIVDAKTAEYSETVGRIIAEYGEVFRTARFLSGRNLNAYRRLLRDQHNLQIALKLAPRLRSLAGRYERRAARRWPPGGVIRPPDIPALVERRDTKRLLRALGHRKDDVRVRAAKGLGELRAPEAVGPLLDIVEGARRPGRPPSEELHQAAVEALAMIADPRTADALVRHAREHLGRLEGMTALTGLVRMKDERALDLLIAYLRCGFLVNSIVSLLADLGDPRAIPVLRDFISELEDSDPEGEASRRLRDSGLREARTALARLETDDE